MFADASFSCCSHNTTRSARASKLAAERRNYSPVSGNWVCSASSRRICAVRRYSAILSVMPGSPFAPSSRRLGYTLLGRKVPAMLSGSSCTAGPLLPQRSHRRETGANPRSAHDGSACAGARFLTLLSMTAGLPALVEAARQIPNGSVLRYGATFAPCPGHLVVMAVTALPQLNPAVWQRLWSLRASATWAGPCGGTCPGMQDGRPSGHQSTRDCTRPPRRPWVGIGLRRVVTIAAAIEQASYAQSERKG